MAKRVNRELAVIRKKRRGIRQKRVCCVCVSRPDYSDIQHAIPHEKALSTSARMSIRANLSGIVGINGTAWRIPSLSFIFSLFLGQMCSEALNES